MLNTKMLLECAFSFVVGTFVVSNSHCMENVKNSNPNLNNSFLLFTENEAPKNDDNTSTSDESASVAENVVQYLNDNVKALGEKFARISAGKQYWAFTDEYKKSISIQGALYNHCISHNTVERQKYIDAYLAKAKASYEKNGKTWDSIASSIITAFVYQSFKLEVEDTWHKLSEKFAQQTVFKNYNDFLFDETKKVLLDRMQIVSQFGVTSEVRRHIDAVKHDWECYCVQYSVFTDMEQEKSDANTGVTVRKSVIEQLRQIEMDKICKDLPKNYNNLISDLSKIAKQTGDDPIVSNAITGLVQSKDECFKNLLTIYKVVNNRTINPMGAKKVGEALDNFVNKSNLSTNMAALLNAQDDNARELGMCLDKMISCITLRTSDKIMIASEDNVDNKNEEDAKQVVDNTVDWNYYKWWNWDDVRQYKAFLLQQSNCEGLKPYWNTFCQRYTSGNDGNLRKVDIGLYLPWTSNPYDHVFDINEDAWIVTDLPYQNFDVGDTEEFLKQRRNEYYVKLRRAAVNGDGELHARILNKLLSVIDLAEKLGLSLEYDPNAIGDLNTLEEAKALAVHFSMFDEGLWNAFVTRYYNVEGNESAVFDFKKDNWIVKKLPLIPAKAAKSMLEQKKKEYYSELARLSGENVAIKRQSLLMKLEGLKALADTIVVQD